MDSMWEETMGLPSVWDFDEKRRHGSFAVDVDETKEAITLRAQWPGIRKEDVKIHCDGNVLTVSGEMRVENISDDEEIHRAELAFGSFERSFTLPVAIKPKDIKVVCKKDVLAVKIPKVKESMPRGVDIKIKRTKGESAFDFKAGAK
jgi:HSP20 family protein